MKIYVDAIFFINFSYDLFLLMATSYLLKEHVTIRKMVLGAGVGAFGILFLFFPIRMWELFWIKIGISILMILVTFSYTNKTLFLKRLGTLYLSSVLLGGILYLFNDAFCYERQGILFMRNKTSIHFVLILLVGPILFSFYMKKIKEEKRNLSLTHFIEFQACGKKYQVEGYLDTGNQLKDPFKRRSVLLLYEKDFLPKIEDSILVPFQTAKGTGLIRCVVPQNLKVDGKLFQNYLVGFLEEKIEIDGKNCILPNQMREELE